MDFALGCFRNMPALTLPSLRASSFSPFVLRERADNRSQQSGKRSSPYSLNNSSMEAGRSLLSSPPPPISRTHLKNLISPSSASRAIISTSTSAVRHFPSSILTLEQQNDYRNSHAAQYKKMAQEFLDLQYMEDSSLSSEEREKHHFDQYLRILECQLLSHPGFWYSFLTTSSSEKASFMTQTDLINNKHADAELTPTEQYKPCTMSPEEVISLAKRALAASHNAALLAERSHNLIHELVEKTLVSGLDPSGPANEIIAVEKNAVRSKKLLERRSKKRKVFRKSKDAPSGTSIPTGTDKVKRIEKNIDNNDPLRLFLWGPETKQLLTIKEEKDLFAQIQDLMELKAVKNKLHMQFGREPTLVEWAQAVGMSCHDLQTFISSGTRSRNRMIYANFRLVIHIAKRYDGKGLNIQDLLQEGSIGLMKSLEKFKPKAGCRFPTYAYWWIRQSIRKAIFLHSRTIRLPENVFAELKRIKDVKRLCLQEGRTPTNEEVAKQAGINISKLDSLLKISKNPISIQDHAWMDQDVTLQEITADPKIEIPEVLVEKQMMRQHVHSLLGVLSPRERKIIRLRFGITYSEPKTLLEIGDMYGISRERVRQIESQALKKLKACCSSQELEVYRELLV